MNPAVIDLHCDLLSYLQEAPDPNPLDKESIGCNFISLNEGNVKLQVMAIFAATEKGSSELGLQQSSLFKKMLLDYPDQISLFKDQKNLQTILESNKIAVLAAIENASAFCEEEEELSKGFKKLDKIISNTEKVLYIGFTHHAENRFGGGNGTKVGLKKDGEALLDYLNGKKIAVDFSHTSDPLAYAILEFISKNKLDIPVIASHSNFRSVFNHLRNLPDDIAKEIINRKGLIGMNFLRAFLNNQNPDALYDHILHGIKLGGMHALCFGADYFFTDSHPDQSRKPFFHKEHENAGCYSSILNQLSTQVSSDTITCISNKNVLDFIKRTWI